VDLDRIFEPFFTTKPDGMGMGLMFCRSVIEAHGGRLLVSPTNPSGVSFEFTLPAADLPESTVVER
jgi:signal transduction histidine kinase